MLLPRKSKLPQSETGFSVIEVILFLGISSFLLIGIFNTYSDTRKRAQFRDAVQQAAGVLQQIKTETNTTVNTQGSGNDASSLALGKMAYIPYGSSGDKKIEVHTVKTNLKGEFSSMSLQHDRTIDLPWGARFTSANITPVGKLLSLLPLGGGCGKNCLYVMFYRNAQDGHLESMAGIKKGQVQNKACIEIQSAPPENFPARIDIDLKNNQVKTTFDAYC